MALVVGTRFAPYAEEMADDEEEGAIGESEEVDQSSGVMAGVGLTFLLHLVFQYLFTIAAPDAAAVAFIGVSQVPYMGLAIVAALAGRKKALAKGLGIGFATTFLLNAACFGFVMATFRH